MRQKAVRDGSSRDIASLEGAALVRSLSTLKLFAISFGSIVGVGWITLVGTWLQKAGPLGAILAFAAGFVTVCLVAMVYLELATSIPKAGAEVAYTESALGRQAAFVVGWSLLLVYVALIAFFMISCSWILGVIWPDMRGPVLWSVFGMPVRGGELAASITALAVITGWNVAAASVAASAQIVLMAIKLGFTILFVAAAAWAGHGENLQPWFAVAGPSAGSMPGLFAVFATSLLFFSGFNYLPQAMEETANDVDLPKIKLALFGSIFLAFLFYAAVILATGAVIPRSRLQGLDLPAADAFQLALGSLVLRNVVLVAGLIGILTAWNGTLFAAGRVGLLLARLSLIPARLGQISPRYRTPANALLSLALIGGVLGGMGRAAILPLVSIASAVIPLTWVFVGISALVLRRRLPSEERPYLAPGGNAILLAALFISTFAFAVAMSDVLSGDNYLFAGSFLVFWIVVGGAIRWRGLARSSVGGER